MFYYGAGTDVHLLLLKCSMVGVEVDRRETERARERGVAERGRKLCPNLRNGSTPRAHNYLLENGVACSSNERGEWRKEGRKEGTKERSDGS